MARAVQWQTEGWTVERQFPEERIVLTVPEAARALGIGRHQAYRACRRGDLTAFRVGRRVLVSRAALERAVGMPRAESAPDPRRPLGAPDDRDA